MLYDIANQSYKDNANEINQHNNTESRNQYTKHIQILQSIS